MALPFRALPLRQCGSLMRCYAHFRTRLLHVFHIPPVLRAGAECTRPTAFARQSLLTGGRSASLPLTSDAVSGSPAPSPFYLHTSTRLLSRTRALLLPSCPHLFGSGARNAVPVFTPPPLSEAGVSPSSFLGTEKLLTPSGFGHYHHTLFRAVMGNASPAFATELAWMVPSTNQPCIRVASNHASGRAGRLRM